MSNLQRGSRRRNSGGILSSMFAVSFLFFSVFMITRESLSQPAVTPNAQVFTSADESSPVVERVIDGGSLTPIGEMIVGGSKWFMVKTKNGNVGWIKSGASTQAIKIGDHFRSLREDNTPIGSVTTALEPTSAGPLGGAVIIPVKIDGPKVVVPVGFRNGYSNATAHLALDTGAAQTMVSRRIARELHLRSVDSQRRLGIGGSVMVDVGVVDAIKVGKAEVKNMRISIHDRPLALGYEGLLGFDFLGQFQMSVDAEKQQLVLTPRRN
jgi:predicted aspartyl protease